MKITFEITPKDGVDPLIFGQAIAWLQQIDAGAVVNVFPPALTGHSTENEALRRGEYRPPGNENTEEESEEAESAANAAVTSDLATAAAAVGPKKRGRKPKAQTAEAQVAALTGASPAGALPPGVTQPAFAPPPAGVAAALPPSAQTQSEQGAGFAIPPGAVGGNGFAPAAPPPPEAAMPAAAPPPPQAPNGALSLEDYKAQVMQFQTAAQSANKPNAYPFNIIRAQTWPDGTPKPFNTMMHDSVPPEFRQLVLDWSAHLLNS